MYFIFVFKMPDQSPLCMLSSISLSCDLRNITMCKNKAR